MQPTSSQPDSAQTSSATFPDPSVANTLPGLVRSKSAITAPPVTSTGPLSVNSVHQCTAHLRDGSGKRCRRPAVNGSNVCISHGGGAPQVRKKAAERVAHELALLMPKATRVLHEALDDRSEYDNSLKVRTAFGVLDRTGFNAKTEIDLSGTVQVEDGSPIPLDNLPLWVKMLTVCVLEGQNISRDLEDKLIGELGLQLTNIEANNEISDDGDLVIDNSPIDDGYNLSNLETSPNMIKESSNVVDGDNGNGWVTTTLTIKRRIIKEIT